MNALADENENNQGTLLKDNLNVTDLMTSSPIMNKKKMMHELKNMGVAQRDADIKNTFQTPMPQLRGLKRMNDSSEGGGRTAVDPRL